MPIPFFKIGDIVPEVTIPISLLSLSKILYPFLGIPLSINSNPIKFLLVPFDIVSKINFFPIQPK